MSYYYVVSKKNKSRGKRKFASKNVLRRFCLFILLILTVVSIINWYVSRIRPVLIESTEANIRSQTAMAINKAILGVVGADTTYNNLVKVEKNVNDDIVMLTANTNVINTLARNMAVIVQKEIMSLKDVGIAVPIGTLSGVPFLTGSGSDIKIDVTPISSVSCSFVSDFESAGINQTLHKIYIQIDSDVEVIMPTLRKTIASSNSVLVCETLIVGDVPESFFSGSLLGSTQTLSELG